MNPLAFLANPKFWTGVGQYGSLLGGLGGQGGQSAGQQPQQPMNQFMPGGMMASRQMPSYSQIIQQMLSQQRGQ